MAYDPDTKKRFALPVDPPIPPHMRAANLSKGQRDAFARTDKLTAKAEKASPAMRRGGRSKKDAKARAGVKALQKSASRSSKETRATSPATAADSSTEA